MKLLIAAIALCGLSYAQPPKIEVASDAPVTIGPNLMHQLRGGTVATVTNKSDTPIRWLTFQLRSRDGLSTERVSVDLRPGDKDRVELTLVGNASSHPDLSGADITITSVEFADGASWRAAR